MKKGTTMISLKSTSNALLRMVQLQTSLDYIVVADCRILDRDTSSMLLVVVLLKSLWWFSETVAKEWKEEPSVLDSSSILDYLTWLFQSLCCFHSGSDQVIEGHVRGRRDRGLVKNFIIPLFLRHQFICTCDASCICRNSPARSKHINTSYV